MDKIELIKRYYNGKISKGATSQEITTILLKDEQSSVTTERIFYAEGSNLESVKGTCSLATFLDNLGEERDISFAISRIVQTCEKIENTYSSNFVPERVQGKLIPYAIRINGRYFEYANRESQEDNYRFAINFIENFNPLLKLNNKLLKLILTSSVFTQEV